VSRQLVEPLGSERGADTVEVVLAAAVDVEYARRKRLAVTVEQDERDPHARAGDAGVGPGISRGALDRPPHRAHDSGPPGGGVKFRQIGRRITCRVLDRRVRYRVAGTYGVGRNLGARSASVDSKDELGLGVHVFGSVSR
jgi:hypothetical protein